MRDRIVWDLPWQHVASMPGCLWIITRFCLFLVHLVDKFRILLTPRCFSTNCPCPSHNVFCLLLNQDWTWSIMLCLSYSFLQRTITWAIDPNSFFAHFKFDIYIFVQCRKVNVLRWVGIQVIVWLVNCLVTSLALLIFAMRVNLYVLQFLVCSILLDIRVRLNLLPNGRFTRRR